MTGSIPIIGCGQTPEMEITPTAQFELLPRVTGGVSAGNALKVSGGAASGVHLRDMDDLDWSSKHSRALCETSQAVRDLYEEISKPDHALCYISAFESHGKLNGASEGVMRVIHFNDGSESKIKFELKSEAGQLRQFTLWSCGPEGSGQNAFLKQEFTSLPGGLSRAEIRAKSSIHVGLEDGSILEAGNDARVSGIVFQEDGTWQYKQISSMQSYILDSADSEADLKFTGELELEQSVNSARMSAFRIGALGSLTFQSQIVASFRTSRLDEPSSLSLGDGSARFAIQHGEWADEGVASWDSAERVNLEDPRQGLEFEDVVSTELPSPAEAQVYYNDGEIWDCSASGESVQLIDLRDASVELRERIESCDSIYDLSSTGSGKFSCSSAQ